MSIKQQVFSGVFYTALSKYAGIVISLVVTAVLARLLSPDDFGVVAVASVIIAFFGLFTDMGLSPAIVQHKDLSKAQLSDLFSFTFFLGIILAGLFFLFSPLIAAYYQRPMLTTICQILSINLFFASVNIVPNALFYRDKAFKYISIRGFSIQLAGGIVAIIAALWGAGLYALIINPILSSCLIFLISIRRYPQKLRLTMGIPTLRRLFSYSAYQFLFNTINYFSRNLDTLLIGKYIGMGALGYYDKAYRLMTLPLQNITQVITPVMHPILSDYQNDRQKLGESHEKIVRLLAAIGFPLSVFLFFSSKEITLLFFGDQWLASVPVFRILSLSVGVQIVLSSSGSIFQAAGDTRSLFVCGVFSSVLNVSGILLGVFYFKSLEAVAICLCISFSINFVQCYFQMYWVTLKRSFYLFFKQLVGPLIFSFGLILLLGTTVCFLPVLDLLTTLFFKAAIFVLAWLAYIHYSGIFNVGGLFRKLLDRF
jgi:O-antigen/teichoic acid export membrane protein